MSETPGRLLLLGPQRPTPNLSLALAAAKVKGPVAVITAGWRHEEAELDALQRDLPYHLVHLPLYRWFDEVMVRDAALNAAYRSRQDRVLAYKELYRLRLSAAYASVLRLHRMPRTQTDLHEAELLDAVEVVRCLDSRSVEVCEQIRQDTVAVRADHPAAAPYSQRVAEIMGHCDAVVIAGGHVAVLLNRLLFFDMDQRIAELMARGGTVAAWSAGAMALSERVVLFYDDPPEGPSEPEVLDRGLGLIRGKTLFPHARRRLRLDTPDRLRMLQARFGECVGLENGAWVEISDGGWQDYSEPDSLLHLSPGWGR